MKTSSERGKKAIITKEYKPNYMVCILEYDPSNLQETLSSFDSLKFNER